MAYRHLYAARVQCGTVKRPVERECAHWVTIAWGKGWTRDRVSFSLRDRPKKTNPFRQRSSDVNELPIRTPAPPRPRPDAGWLEDCSGFNGGSQFCQVVGVSRIDADFP
ncbi:MAG: hypothetical protein F9B45_08135 [Phycisphaera sp. RhM]|nr:hypothetical protein [Phycisphaera sp. RhM]